MVKKILQSKWFIPFALILLGLVGFAILGKLPILVANKKEVANLQRKVIETNNKITELQYKKDIANSESYLERQARLRLNMKMPGEKVAIIYKNQYNQEQADQQKSQDNSQPDIWQKILNWIGGK